LNVSRHTSNACANELGGVPKMRYKSNVRSIEHQFENFY
jgi:hypothetical protein